MPKKRTSEESIDKYINKTTAKRKKQSNNNDASCSSNYDTTYCYSVSNIIL